MKTETIEYKGLLITVEPEVNSDRTFTGDWNFSIDDEETIKQLQDGSGFTSAQAAEEEAKKWIDKNHKNKTT